MSDAYIVAARRTVIGKEGGSLAAIEPDALAGTAMRALLDASGAPAVDRVLLANTTGTGNIARTAALAAGIDPGVPGTTINNQCSGGLTAIRLAAEAIAARQAGVVIAGGVESVSQALVALDGWRTDGGRPRVRHVPADWPAVGLGPSADRTAEALAITREAQDAYAHESRQRYHEAEGRGDLAGWRVAIGGAGADELAARPAPPLERLARYPAAFTPAGSVTAGNCAAAADGAAAALIASRDGAERTGLAPLARLVAAAPAAGDPAQPALAILPAIDRALAAARLRPGDIDLWEVNEAFAVKAIAAMRRYEIEREQINVLGGAIAFGHPFAASGAVLLLHLLAALEQHGARRGLLAIAGAGGVAEAMIIEHVEGAT